MTVAVIGLGLIGGSFAKAIREKTSHLVLGSDKVPEVMNEALSRNVIDGEAGENLNKADLILVALYPSAAISFISENLNAFQPGAVVVDLCGVKRAVCSEAAALLQGSGVIFVGGHPMAGREYSGFLNSLPSLFEGASMILTPGADVNTQTLAWLEKFFISLGFSRVTKTTPDMHDDMIAYTSQLAHVVSSAYVQNPASSGYKGYSAGSFADMTRVARLNEEMWTELFLMNADYLAGHISNLIGMLDAFRSHIENGDRDGLKDMLSRGVRIMEEIHE